MNKIKLLNKLNDFFDTEKSKQLEEIASLQQVLSQLAHKKTKTQKRIQQCHDHTLKKALLLELSVIEAHIDKGKKLLQQLTEE